jgi:hypothetical protein
MNIKELHTFPPALILKTEDLKAGATTPDTCGTAQESQYTSYHSLLAPSTGEQKGIFGIPLTQARSALSDQEGGKHYKKYKIQPVEYSIANRLGFLPGNIVKYATRYADKGGAEDIRKIIHYARLILEFEYGETT